MKVIWFSEIKWNFLTHRHHHLIRHFPDDWEILFVENFAVGKKSHFLPRRDGKVTYVTIPNFKGTEYPAVNALQNQSWFRAVFTFLFLCWTRLILLMTGFSGSNRIVFTSNIYFADIIRRLKKGLTVYDCNDYPMGFSGALKVTEMYFKRTVEVSDVVLTVSDKLLEDVKKYKSENGHVVGNGVDYDLFACNALLGEPSDITRIAKPIAFYAGVVSDWFDFELVERLAKEAPEISVVIVGPVISPHVKEYVDRLTSLSNVHFLGMRKHDQLPAYVHASQVCMIPFKKTPLIERFSPNKMYEYLAAGRPVVTLDYTEEIKRLRENIHVAESQEEFVRLVIKAAKGLPDETRLQRIAFENSWKSRSDEVVRLIRNALVRMAK